MNALVHFCMKCLSNVPLPLDIDVTHGLSSSHRYFIQNYITGVPHYHTQDILLWLAQTDIHRVGNVRVLGEDVHPHVQFPLGDFGLEGVIKTSRLNVFGNQVLLAEDVDCQTLFRYLCDILMLLYVLLCTHKSNTHYQMHILEILLLYAHEAY